MRWEPAGLSKGVSDRLPSALTAVCALIAVIGALVPWLTHIETWRVAGDPTMAPAPDVDVPRLLLFAEMVQYWPYTSGGGILLVAMVASVAVFAICGFSRVVGMSVGQRRTVVLVVGAAGALSALAALSLVAVWLYAMTSTPEELVGVYLSDRSGLGATARLLELGAMLLGWVGVLLLGAASWGRLGVALDDDERADGEPEGDTRFAPPVDDPPAQGRVADLPAAAPRERVDPARLRPDGSSDSGFDEFHFRR